MAANRSVLAIIVVFTVFASAPSIQAQIFFGNICETPFWNCDGSTATLDGQALQQTVLDLFSVGRDVMADFHNDPQIKIVKIGSNVPLNLKKIRGLSIEEVEISGPAKRITDLCLFANVSNLPSLRKAEIRDAEVTLVHAQQLQNCGEAFDPRSGEVRSAAPAPAPAPAPITPILEIIIRNSTILRDEKETGQDFYFFHDAPTVTMLRLSSVDFKNSRQLKGQERMVADRLSFGLDHSCDCRFEEGKANFKNSCKTGNACKNFGNNTSGAGGRTLRVQSPLLPIFAALVTFVAAVASF